MLGGDGREDTVSLRLNCGYPPERQQIQFGNPTRWLYVPDFHVHLVVHLVKDRKACQT